jgi:hypothetical protein
MSMQIKGRTKKQIASAKQRARIEALAQPPGPPTPPPALQRIVMAYEDGTAIMLEGRDARRWETAVNGQIVLGSLHGVSFPDFPWKKLFGGPTEK